MVHFVRYDGRRGEGKGKENRAKGVRGNAESPKSLYRIVIKQLRSYFALLGKYAVSLFSTRCDYEERWREACQEMRRNGETGAGRVIYVTTLHFTSSDSTANLPRDYTFATAGAQVHTFSGLVLRKKGPQTITITEPGDPSLTTTISIDVV